MGLVRLVALLRALPRPPGKAGPEAPYNMRRPFDCWSGCSGNDVTFQMGTFGVTEDLLFQRASEIARKEVRCWTRFLCRWQPRTRMHFVCSSCPVFGSLEILPRRHCTPGLLSRLGIKQRAKKVLLDTRRFVLSHVERTDREGLFVQKKKSDRRLEGLCVGDDQWNGVLFVIPQQPRYVGDFYSPAIRAATARQMNCM